MKYRVIAIVLSFFLLLGSSVQAQEEKKRSWIIPGYLNLQYAGGVGKYVVGAGYNLNKSESLRFLLQYGFTPKHSAKKNLHTSTLRFNYLPVRFALFDSLSVKPTLGLAVSRVFADGPGTFTRLPSYYPEGYYAPNAFRFHFSVGATFSYKFKQDFFIRTLEFYAESTTNDLYVKYYLKYDPIKFTDVFSVALGLNIRF